jgi:predicted secreted Zn-dependent protease
MLGLEVIEKKHGKFNVWELRKIYDKLRGLDLTDDELRPICEKMRDEFLKKPRTYEVVNYITKEITELPL